MRILPINSYTNTVQKNKASENRFQSESLTFGGIMDVFKRRSDKISKDTALNMIKQAGISDMESIELMVYAANYKDSIWNYSRKMLENMLKLIKADLPIEDYVSLRHGGATDRRINEFDKMTKNIFKILELGYPKKYLPMFIEYTAQKLEDAKALVDIKDEAIKRRSDFSYYSYKVDDEALTRLFLDDPQSTLNFYKLMGRDAFLNSFKDKLDNVQKYIECIGAEISEDSPKYQELLELVNPKESDRYKANQTKIKNLKNDWKEHPNLLRKKSLEAKINTLTRENRRMEANSVKDYQKKIDILMTYRLFLEDSNRLKHVFPLLNSDKVKDRKRRNILISDTLMTVEGKKCNRFNFVNNKYLPQLCRADSLFMRAHNSLVSFLNDFPYDNLDNILEKAAANSKTKKMFKQNGIDYNAWVKYNPKSYLETVVHFNPEQQKQAFFNHLEQIFNSDVFADIPQKEVENLKKALSAGGIKLVSGNGSIKLYKDEKPLKFEDVGEFFNLVLKELSMNDFWKLPNKDDVIDEAKSTIEVLLLDNCFKEYRAITTRKGDVPKTLRIKKVDMNNIEHSYFLGNHAGNCCTAVGNGLNQDSAPSYVLNNLFSAIEVLDEGEPVGNTMCYFINVSGKPALMIDNIGLKDEYKYVDGIRDAIIEYAKQIGKEVGIENLPIYASANPHGVDMDKFPKKVYSFSIIGETIEGLPAYFDFESDFCELKKDSQFVAKLHKIN